MKKKISKIFAALLICAMICSSVAPSQAVQPQNEISPLYVEPITIHWTAMVDGSNELSVAYSYSATDSQVTDVVITTYVEKRSLLVIWNRVDIGETNNEWIDYGAGDHFSMNHSVQLPNSGTYRVTITFDVYNGSTLIDTIEKTQTVSC